MVAEIWPMRLSVKDLERIRGKESRQDGEEGDEAGRDCAL
jgi:hypothetical protein